jgi:hypothetical protein
MGKREGKEVGKRKRKGEGKGRPKGLKGPKVKPFSC